MKQAEYIRELKINLESKVSPTELEDILSDYESFFAAGREDGKSDDQISDELGSPAFLAKTLLEEHERKGSTESKNELMKNIADPGRRLLAYIIDVFVAVFPAAIISFVIASNILLPIMMIVMSPSPLTSASIYLAYPYAISDEVVIHSENTSNSNVDSTYVYRKGINGEWRLTTKPSGVLFRIFTITGLVFYLLYSTLCTMLFKGQTLGKRLMRIKVKRSNNDHASAGVIFTREFLGKVLINSIPIVPIISLLTILLTKENKALHDMLTDTVVTNI